MQKYFCRDRQSLKGSNLQHKNKTSKEPTVFKHEIFMIPSYKLKLVKWVGFVCALNRRANELECCELHCRSIRMDKRFENLRIYIYVKKKKKKKNVEHNLCQVSW